MADEDEIAALVIDNGSGMCKGGLMCDVQFAGWLDVVSGLVWEFLWCTVLVGGSSWALGVWGRQCRGGAMAMPHN